MAVAKRLFDCFVAATFEYDGPVGFICIEDGDMAMPERSWASGFLCLETIEEVQRSGDEPTHVARISLECGGDQPVPIVRVEPIRGAAPALSAYDHYERAMDSNNLDISIRELDACLCLNPEPLLAIGAYYNLSAAVWEKFQFNERKSDTVEDDEIRWARGCNLCLRRALKIYDDLPRVEQLEADVIKLHQAIKESIGVTAHYGAYIYKFGRMQFRAVHGLPDLRCLREIDMPLNP
ncbi:MAG: hypothetical protein ABSH44_15270 [Bryobacteraceae bacterium]|jgi:hypothetical protein